MGDQIIVLQEWLQTPVGQYLLAWERTQVDAAVADLFGFHALQLGVPELDGLQANRMPHRWLATEQAQTPAGHGLSPSAFHCDFTALPFSAASLDLVLLPHTLEFSADPHATLREVERVLVPEGRVVICGFNPVSLWALRQRRGHLYRRLGVGNLFLPEGIACIGHWRLRDWLRLLGLEVEVASFGCYRPAVAGEAWLNRFAWMDRVGQRWWPIFGSAYFLVAVKRVRGMRLMEPGWRGAPARAGDAVSVTNRSHDH